MIVKMVISVAIISASYWVMAQDHATRFGVLRVNSENILIYNNKLISPIIQGNDGLEVLKIYRQGSSDAVLVMDRGGNACPAQFYFLAISAVGVFATSVFGTCSDEIDIKREAEAVTITMPGFVGPFEKKSAQLKASQEKHIYIFKSGFLIESIERVK
jgi:hypothetical protein